MTINSTIKPTVLVLLFSLIFSVFTIWYWPSWQRGKSTPFTWDVELYYAYLPAAFIHHDLSFSYPHPHPMGTAPKTGIKIPKYTCGMAFMYMPFFFLGHKIAHNQKSPTDGFSEPYATCIHWGSVFYVLLGPFFLRKVLLRFFSEGISATLLLIALFGTNLFFYTYYEGEYTHGYLFCLVSVFLWQTIRWHEKQSWGLAIGLGLILGLITLIRPTDILIGLLFVLFNVVSWQTFKDKWQLLWARKWQVAVMGLCVFLVFSIQMIYWKKMTGDWLYQSYGDEGFFWSDPKFKFVLLSYRKGWLVYTPVMVLSLLGLFFLRRHARNFLWAIPVFFVLNLYVVSSWWCWWYGGSFGMRALVETYPVMLIALGAFLTWCIHSASRYKLTDVLKKYGATAFVMACICLNLVQTYQYKRDMIHYDSMNGKAYWHVFGKFEWMNDDQQKFYDYLQENEIDYDKAKQGPGRN